MSLNVQPKYKLSVVIVLKLDRVQLLTDNHIIQHSLILIFVHRSSWFLMSAVSFNIYTLSCELCKCTLYNIHNFVGSDSNFVNARFSSDRE